MAVASCIVVADLPVRQLFLLQPVHCIAAWLGPEACYPVLRHAVKEIMLLPHQEDPGGRAIRSQEASRKQKEPGYLISGAGFWPDFSVFFGEITQQLRAGKK